MMGAKAPKSPSPLSPAPPTQSSPPPPLSPTENLAPESPYSPPSHSPPLLSCLSTPISSPISATLSPLASLDPLSPYIWDTSTDAPPSDTSSYGDESSTEDQLSPPQFNFHPDYPPRAQIGEGKVNKPLHNMKILWEYLKRFRPTDTPGWTQALLEIKINTFHFRIQQMIWFLRTYLRSYRKGAIEVVRGWGVANDSKILDKLRQLKTSVANGCHLDVDSDLVELFRLLGRERKLFRFSRKIYLSFNIVRNDLRVVRAGNKHFMPT